MAISQEQLNELQEILFNEYGLRLTDSDVSSEALRLSEFAKTVLHFSLSKND
jgi:hypothetical protein